MLKILILFIYIVSHVLGNLISTIAITISNVSTTISTHISTTISTNITTHISTIAVMPTGTTLPSRYDYVTYPIWFLAQKPWRTKRVARTIHSKWAEPEGGELVFSSTVQPTAVNRDMRRYNLNTMEKVFSHVVGRYNDRQALGTRWDEMRLR